MSHYQRDGISFQYPETWNLTPENYDSGWALTVASPGTAFLTLTLDTSGSPPAMLADATLLALGEEYPSLESEPTNDTIARSPAIGHDVRFFAMDLTNTCYIRALGTGVGALLIYWQATDSEDQPLQVLRAICASLSINDE